jgi:hypothetical protein
MDECLNADRWRARAEGDREGGDRGRLPTQGQGTTARHRLRVRAGAHAASIDLGSGHDDEQGDVREAVGASSDVCSALVWLALVHRVGGGLGGLA